MLPEAIADLPVVEVLPALADALRRGARAVLVAPPGAGKTTAAPLWLLDQPWLTGRIVMLEPRRLATRAAARRMADLLGEPVGQTVGYQTRDERVIGASTRVEVVTEGVLTRRLQHDPSLPGVGLVIFDEVHERNLPTDVGLAFALDSIGSLRPDLRLLLMSATPQIEPLRRVLAHDGSDVKVIESDGRMHPVDLVWMPLKARERIEPAVAAAVRRALREQPGDLLVFLPGIGEIRRVEGLLTDLADSGVDVLPLAGALSLAEQDRALTASSRRRVVLSTDIAESSLTVPGVRVVVDAGLARVPRHDVRTGMTRLVTISTSRASADQRAGRAGRTEPGAAYRLWSKLEHATRRAHLDAEITQVDLAGLALELALWGSSDVPFIDAPPAKAMQEARRLLQLLGALDADGAVTALGRRVAALPVHPRLATMVAAASPADVGLACVLAALVDERDIFRGTGAPADVALRVAVLGGIGDDRADRRDVARARDRAVDIARRADVRIDWSALHGERAGAVLAHGFPDRLAIRRSQPAQFQLRGGGGAFTERTDPIGEERFLIVADLDGKRDNARIRLAAAIDAEEVAVAFAAEVELRVSVAWDKQRDDLLERWETRLGSLLLDEQVRQPLPGDDTTAALVGRVRATRLAALAWSPESTTLRQRVAFLRAQRPDEGWPDWSDSALLKSLDDWLAPFLVGATGAADLRRLDTTMLLRSQLSWDVAQRLDELAPTALHTAAGRDAVIDYSRPMPTASVRVQDLFGTTAHPSVDGGRVPLTLELLSPADRPVQITADLPGFWAGSWSEVRKEMAGRYPKHQWPADPAAAFPSRLKRS